MTPWEELAEFLTAIDSSVSVYPTPTEQMDAPSYVIVPGEPWIDPSAPHASFSNEPERYDVWAIAQASMSWASMPLIHAMLHAVRHNLPENWSFDSAGQFGQVEHQGITYFGAPLRLIFNRCDNGESES